MEALGQVQVSDSGRRVIFPLTQAGFPFESPPSLLTISLRQVHSGLFFIPLPARKTSLSFRQDRLCFSGNHFQALTFPPSNQQLSQDMLGQLCQVQNKSPKNQAGEI